MCKLLFILKNSDVEKLNIDLDSNSYFKKIDGKFKVKYGYTTDLIDGDRKPKEKTFNWYKSNNYYFLNIENAIIEKFISAIRENATQNNFDYIAFHPASESIPENEKIIESMNAGINENPKYTFFSRTEDGIEELDQLIKKVEERIAGEDKIPEECYNLKQKLSALKKVLEFEQKTIDKINEDIENINQDISYIYKNDIKLEKMQISESIITPLSNNISLLNEFLKSKEKIYDKTY